MEAWHFIQPNKKLRFEPFTEIKVGETLKCDPDKIELCKFGFHASVKPVDALSFVSWDDAWICKVKLGGKIITGPDKVVSSERTVIWMHPVDDLLWEWACCCAEDVLHLANDPRSGAAVKARRDYQLGLITKDDLAAAMAAARDAARDAAMAARDAARAAAWDAAMAAAMAAARDAAMAAARAAAWAAASAAAWAAARDAQNSLLEDMLNDMHVFLGDEP